MAKLERANVKFSGVVSGFKQNLVKGGSYQITIESKTDPEVGSAFLKALQHGERAADIIIDFDESQQDLPYDEDGESQMHLDTPSAIVRRTGRKNRDLEKTSGDEPV